MGWSLKTPGRFYSETVLEALRALSRVGVRAQGRFSHDKARWNRRLRGCMPRVVACWGVSRYWPQPLSGSMLHRKSRARARISSDSLRCPRTWRLMVERSGFELSVPPVLTRKRPILSAFLSPLGLEGDRALPAVGSMKLRAGRVTSLRAPAACTGLRRRHVNYVLPLAFLAPDIDEAIAASRQPGGSPHKGSSSAAFRPFCHSTGRSTEAHARDGVRGPAHWGLHRSRAQPRTFAMPHVRDS